MKEELGIDGVSLHLLDKFYTSGQIGNKKINRFNSIYLASYDKNDFTLQESEVEKVKWFNLENLYKEIETNPEKFTHGLVTILNEYKKAISSHINHR